MILRRKLSESRLANAQAAAEQIETEARKEAESICKEATIQAKDVVLQAKTDWEKEMRELRRESDARAAADRARRCLLPGQLAADNLVEAKPRFDAR